MVAHKPLASLLKNKAMTENQNTKLQVTPTTIPDVLILEPKVFVITGVGLLSRLMPMILQRQAICMWGLCKITTPSRSSGLCGDCIISSSVPKANWFE